MVQYIAGCHGPRMHVFVDGWSVRIGYVCVAGIAELPLRPKHVDVTVVQVEDRVARRRPSIHYTTDPAVWAVMNVVLQRFPEHVVSWLVQHAVNSVGM